MKVLKERHLRYKKERKYRFLVFFIALIFLFPFKLVQSETYYSPKLRSEYYKDQINKLIINRPSESNKLPNYFSSAFLGLPYKAHTLIGDKNNKEVFVLNLDEMDCFTYLDYIQSLIESKDYYSFISKLKYVRYKDGIVSFKNRNHFFYDWSQNVKGLLDVTSTIFTQKSVKITKNLNLKDDGKFFLDGIPVKKVYISYLPSKHLNKNNLEKLKSGDYIGIYTHIKGLDVSHVGIFIKKEQGYFYRNASSLSKNNKIVDTDFLDYIKDKPGIIIYRNSL